MGRDILAQPENPGDDTIIKGNPFVCWKCNVALVLYCDRSCNGSLFNCILGRMKILRGKPSSSVKFSAFFCESGASGCSFPPALVLSFGASRLGKLGIKKLFMACPHYLLPYPKNGCPETGRGNHS